MGLIIDVLSKKIEIQAVDDYHEDSKSAFFGQFLNDATWVYLMRLNNYVAAENLLKESLKYAYEWEKKNPGVPIHKGTPYYFLSVTCLKSGDYEKGLLYMHQAYNEDKKNNKKPEECPAYFFITLKYEKRDQYLHAMVKELADWIDLKLKVYNGNLKLEDFKSKFLANTNMTDEVFFFVYQMLRLKKILDEKKEIRANTFGALFLGNLIFAFAQLLENVIDKASKSGKLLKEQIEYVSEKTKLNLHKKIKGKQTEIGLLNNCFSCAFPIALEDLLDSKKSFSDGSAYSKIEEDFGIVYGFRNHFAHNIKEHEIIYKRFDEIYQRVLNAFFYTLETLH